MILAWLATIAFGQGASQTHGYLKASGGSYSVEVVTKPVTFRSGTEQSTFWGGGGRTPPEEIVTGIVLKSKNTVIRVPRSAYADLSNVNRIWIVKTKGGCVVHLEGGDASVAYRAIFTVRGTDLIDRKVADGEFPEYNWERTVYYSKEPPG